MCGIFLSISTGGPKLPRDDLWRALRARGPDCIQIHQVTVETSSSTAGPGRVVDLVFISTVLALRGSYIQVQPLVDEKTGSVFCWNGEAWKIDDEPIVGNDTATTFELLKNLSRQDADQRTQLVMETLSRVKGPYAFVFYDAVLRKVFYGRDRLGRRSLLIDSSGSVLTISSLTYKSPTSAVEVDASFIHSLSLQNDSHDRHLWPITALRLNQTIPATPNTVHRPSRKSISDLTTRLSESLRLRTTGIFHSVRSQQQSTSPQVAVLFSGGLDCTLLARLVHDILPKEAKIDLLNVAFENPRSLQSKQAKNTEAGSRDPYEICPDRITGRSSYAELCEVCPDRTWCFIAVNVPYNEMLEHKPTVIKLMAPHATEMDLSITMALYFAARGEGVPAVHLPKRKYEFIPKISEGLSSYTTSARVLLSGLGADELFGGYTRHATAFKRGGHAVLVEELELDITRIGSRNLGRDDRVLSHWGRETRFPYLDEDFVQWAVSLPVTEKCGFSTTIATDKSVQISNDRPDDQEQDQDLEPAKLLLRLAARQLGLKKASAEKKRAIQFGAKTAKMEIGAGRKKGTDTLLADPFS